MSRHTETQTDYSPNFSSNVTKAHVGSWNHANMNI